MGFSIYLCVWVLCVSLIQIIKIICHESLIRTYASILFSVCLFEGRLVLEVRALKMERPWNAYANKQMGSEDESKLIDRFVNVFKLKMDSKVPV